MRKSNNKITKNRNNGSSSDGSCLISAGLCILVLLYGGITLHILNRGELSRNHDFNGSSLFPRGKIGNLETHPDLQHHDLSSIFLEGLPPLRSKKNIDEIGADQDNGIKFDHNTRAISNRRQSRTDDLQLRAKYLRGKMPID